MLCKKGEFVTLCQNKLRDITSALLEEVYHNVAIQPILQLVTDNNLVPSTKKQGTVPHYMLVQKKFWITGLKTFLTPGCLTSTFNGTNVASLEQCFAVSEREKKRLYNRRILEVENASFTPLTYTIHVATVGI